MPITVIDVDGDSETFPDGNTWHVDDSQNLHLRSVGNKPVASFAAGRWSSVGQAEVAK